MVALVALLRWSRFLETGIAIPPTTRASAMTIMVSRSVKPAAPPRGGCGPAYPRPTTARGEASRLETSGGDRWS